MKNERVSFNLERYKTKVFQMNYTAKNYVRDVSELQVEIHFYELLLDMIISVVLSPLTAFLLLFYREKFFYQTNESGYSLPGEKNLLISSSTAGILSFLICGFSFMFFFVSYCLTSFICIASYFYFQIKKYYQFRKLVKERINELQ